MPHLHCSYHSTAGPSVTRHSNNACLDPLSKRMASYHITFQIMERIHSLLSNHADNYYNLMIWAACSTAYFGLLRVSKSTTSSPKHSTSFTNLFLSDITIDSHVAPQVANQNHFETSKTDQYRQGTHIYFDRTDHQVCPVKALIRYLDRRGSRPGPFLYYLPIGP